MVNTKELIERELFLEYTEEYNKFYTGDANNEHYVRHLEECLKIFTAIQDDKTRERLEELYESKNVDFDTTLKTIQTVKNAFEDTSFEQTETTVNPDQPSL